MDHMRKAEELLTEIADTRVLLQALHASATPTDPHRVAIAATYDELRHLSATAKIHATLAVAQATYDAATLREVVGR